MANILVNFEQGIEVAAGDVLKFITQSQAVMTKIEPGVIASLGVLLGATSTALGAVSASAASPVNVQLDAQTVSDVRQVWPALEAFAKSLGIKL
jgi:hypothetical protein